jgi:NTP pyrophosphatase (non-canonical NTP hydrolase)
VWKTREGHEVEVQENIGQLAKDFPWRGSLLGVTEIWRNNGRWLNNVTDDHRDLVAYVRPLPEAETTTDTLAETEEQGNMSQPTRLKDMPSMIAKLQADLAAMTTQRDTLRRQFAAMTADRDRLQEQLQNTSEMQAGTEGQLTAELAELEYDAALYERTVPTENVTIKVTMKIEPTISQMQEYIRQWAIRKGWLTETPRDPAQQLMLIVTELAECCEAFREGNPPCSRPGMEQYSHAAEELADVVIRCLQMAGEHNIPLSEVIEAKMAFNETRPTKHGKKF